MGSTALDEWRGERRRRLRDLHDAYRRATAGGRSGAGLIVDALVLRLAAEFQGFARQLHQEGVVAVARHAAGGDPEVEDVLVAGLTRDLRLGRGSARPEALDADFGRLGVRLRAALRAVDGRADAWLAGLRALHDVRNGLAHDDGDRLAATGYRRDVDEVRRWEATLDVLADAMDGIVGDRLAQVLGGVRPW